MPFALRLSTEAKGQLQDLEHHKAKKDLVKLKRVRKCLGRLQLDPRHPGLNSHKYSDLVGINGEEVWESYVENRTPSAWRLFWHYGPIEGVITVVAITPHP